ncbi:MAG: hypothetical protein RJB30_474 [Actinomycetota bacterium]
MELVRNVLLVLHFAGMAGILVSLIASRTKLSPGLIHSALLALVAGIALVGVRYGLNSQDSEKWETVDNAKITVKFLFVLIILAIAFANKKKEKLSPMVVPLIGALTIGNVIIAYVW